jgi:hypothetical protein
MDNERRPTADELAGIDWWNSLTEPARAFWIDSAGPSVAHAWARRQQLVNAAISADAEPYAAANFVRRLLVLSSAAWDGNELAMAELRHAGDMLAFAGGVIALVETQALAHDYLHNHPELGKGRDLAGHIGAYWEHIDSWAKL